MCYLFQGGSAPTNIIFLIIAQISKKVKFYRGEWGLLFLFDLADEVAQGGGTLEFEVGGGELHLGF